jgi:hypothetical protein
MSENSPVESNTSQRLRHSGPGIASLIVSGSSFVLGVGALIVFNLGSKQFLMGPFCTCGFPTGLAGITLGIVGLALPNRKKTFAYLGLAVGALNVLINGILIMTGHID